MFRFGKREENGIFFFRKFAPFRETLLEYREYDEEDLRLWNNVFAYLSPCVSSLVLQAAVHALLAWVSVPQVYACMSAIASGGGAVTSNNPNQTLK